VFVAQQLFVVLVSIGACVLPLQLLNQITPLIGNAA
jgi:hypothetical protein